MSTIQNIAVVLEALPEGTVIMISGQDGKPNNTAFRTPDLEGNLTWALGGKKDPFTSQKLAKTIVVRDLTWNEMELAW